MDARKPRRREPSIKQFVFDVATVASVFAFMVGAAVSALLRRDFGVIMGVGVLSGGAVGLLTLYWRMLLYDSLVVSQWDGRGGTRSIRPTTTASPSEHLMPLLMRESGGSKTIHLAPTLNGVTKEKLRRLVDAFGSQKGKRVTRDVLAKAGLWNNLTGPGSRRDYLYQEVLEDLRRIGVLEDGNVLSEDGFERLLGMTDG